MSSQMTSHPKCTGWLIYFSWEKTGGLKSMQNSNDADKVNLKSVMERVVFETSVQYRPLNEDTLSGYSCDLSVGGIYLRTQFTFDVDQILTLSFSIPYQEQPFSILCKARIAWTNYHSNRRKPTYPPGVGLQFLGLFQEYQAALAKFIEAYDEDKKMNVLCAWCGSYLGLRKGPVGTTSHGICYQCRKKIE
jgi:uncharacterized protein (TIGR02266 family)